MFWCCAEKNKEDAVLTVDSLAETEPLATSEKRPSVTSEGKGTSIKVVEEAAKEPEPPVPEKRPSQTSAGGEVPAPRLSKTSANGAAEVPAPRLSKTSLQAAEPGAAARVSESKQPTVKEFTIQIEKADSILGLELDLLDGKIGQITDIKAGAIEEYNKSAESSGQDTVQNLDFIIEANQVSGDVQKLLRALKHSTTLEMRIRRTTPFSVSIAQYTVDTSFISTVNHATSGVTLLLLELHELFKQWNANNPDRIVRLNDRILEVNGKRGDPKAMLEVLQAPCDKLDLLMMSPTP